MISQGLIPRGYQQVRSQDAAAHERLRLEAAVDRAAVGVQHREKLIADPRWSSSLNFRVELDRWRERYTKAVADLAEARAPGAARPVVAGQQREREPEPEVQETMYVKHSGYREWKEMIDHRRDESAGKEQAE